MPSDDSGSFTNWLGPLSGAASSTPLSHYGSRYFARLVRLAQARPRTNRRPGAAEDEEDSGAHPWRPRVRPRAR